MINKNHERQGFSKDFAKRDPMEAAQKNVPKLVINS